MASDEQLEAKDKKRAATQSKKALPTGKRPGAGVADWENASPTAIHRLVCTVGREGGAVRLGYTRDGGAYSIGLYLGDNSKTYYCNEVDGIDDQIRELIEFFTE